MGIFGEEAFVEGFFAAYGSSGVLSSHVKKDVCNHAKKPKQRTGTMTGESRGIREAWFEEIPSSLLVWCSSLSLLWSIASLSDLLGGGPARPWSWVGVSLGMAFLRGWKGVGEAQEKEARKGEGDLGWWVQRNLVFLGVVSLGPCLLFFAEAREKSGWLFLGIASLVGWCGSRDLWVLVEGGRRVWRGESELASAPLVLWKACLWIGLVGMPWVLKPYVGRMAAAWVVAASVSVWLLPASAWAIGSWFQRPGLALRWLMPLGFVGGFVGLNLPIPKGSSDREILYSARVGEERLTLQASRQEDLRVYQWVTKRALLYQTVQAYRYAEVLIHPLFSLAASPKRLLLVGGEDGSLLQEIAKYPSPPSIVWIPLFREWADFFRTAPLFGDEIQRTVAKLRPTRLDIAAPENAADWQALLQTLASSSFDRIVLDLPPPQAVFEGLYQPDFQQEILRLLQPQGIAAIHLGSVTNQRQVFWCLIGQWSRQKIHATPYFLAPSSVQDHGFALLSRFPIQPESISISIPVPTRYLHPKQPFSALSTFPKTELPRGSDFHACRLP